MIDWKAKIEEKYLYTKNDKYKDKPIKEVPENDLLLKLGGVQELARLRGFESVEYDISHIEHDHVFAKCRITWAASRVDGHDLPRQVFESVASAKSSGVGPKMADYLETVAENRAFVRAVRRYLGVNIVGEDEINKTSAVKAAEAKSVPEKEIVRPSKMPNALDVLISVCKTRKISVDDLKKMAEDLAKESKIAVSPETVWEWKSFGDIPPKEARTLSGIIQSQINADP